MIYKGKRQSHMIKTGGTYLADALQRTLDPDRVEKMPQHIHMDEVRRKSPPGTEIVGTIRNPWEWYCSVYLHSMTFSADSRFCVRYIGNGKIDFRSFVLGATNLNESNNPSPSYLLIRKRHDGPPIDLSIGMWSNMMVYAYSFGRDYQAEYLIDSHQMNQGIHEVYGVTIPRLESLGKVNTLKQRIHLGRTRRVGSINVHETPNYEDMLDEELIDAIWKADGKMCDNLGYEPFSKASRAVFRPNS